MVGLAEPWLEILAKSQEGLGSVGPLLTEKSSEMEASEWRGPVLGNRLEEQVRFCPARLARQQQCKHQLVNRLGCSIDPIKVSLVSIGGSTRDLGAIGKG